MASRKSTTVGTVPAVHTMNVELITQFTNQINNFETERKELEKLYFEIKNKLESKKESFTEVIFIINTIIYQLYNSFNVNDIQKNMQELIEKINKLKPSSVLHSSVIDKKIIKTIETLHTNILLHMNDINTIIDNLLVANPNHLKTNNSRYNRNYKYYYDAYYEMFKDFIVIDTPEIIKMKKQITELINTKSLIYDKKTPEELLQDLIKDKWSKSCKKVNECIKSKEDKENVEYFNKTEFSANPIYINKLKTFLEKQMNIKKEKKSGKISRTETLFTIIEKIKLLNDEIEIIHKKIKQKMKNERTQAAIIKPIKNNENAEFERQLAELNSGDNPDEDEYIKHFNIDTGEKRTNPLSDEYVEKIKEFLSKNFTPKNIEETVTKKLQKEAAELQKELKALGSSSVSGGSLKKSKKYKIQKYKIQKYKSKQKRNIFSKKTKTKN